MYMKKSVVLLAAVLGISLGCTRQNVDEYSMITFMIGDVKKNSAAVQIGDIIKEKDILETGTDSFCDIKIGDSLIRIKQKTKVILSTLMRQTGLENTTMELDSGKMLC